MTDARRLASGYCLAARRLRRRGSKTWCHSPRTGRGAGARPGHDRPADRHRRLRIAGARLASRLRQRCQSGRRIGHAHIELPTLSVAIDLQPQGTGVTAEQRLSDSRK